MRKWIFIVLAILVVAIFLSYQFFFKGPDLSKYEYLKTPEITKIADQKMLVVTAVGDPNKIVPKSFGLLFQTYFKLKNNKMGMQPPRARWPKPFTTPKDQWLGLYALPVSQTAELPEGLKQTDPNVKVEFQAWKYGTVAQILHIGSYTAEAPTVEKLKKSIREEGYRIVGPHEEEYLKGPGMFGPGDPNKYYTIIRYSVAK